MSVEMETIRERIIKQFIERAKVICSSSPLIYNTELGLKPALRHRQTISPNETPCIVVWAFPEEAVNEYGKSVRSMVVRIEGFVYLTEGDDRSVVAEQVLGDLIRCFTSPEWNRRTGSPPEPDTILSLQYIGGGVSDFKDEEYTVGAYINVSVKYATEIGNPYKL